MMPSIFSAFIAFDAMYRAFASPAGTFFGVKKGEKP